MTQNRILIIAICLMAFGFVSCDDNSDEFTTNPNSFRGTWNIVFSGDYTGQAHLTIDPTGQFFNSMTLENGNGLLDLGGTVGSDGVMEGRLMRGSTQIGTMKGTLSGNAGSGTWQTTDGKTGSFQTTRL